MKLTSAGLAVISTMRSLPTRAVISSHSAPVRPSHHRIAGRSTLLSSSSSTRLSICPLRPRPFTSAGFTPLSASTWEMVSRAAAHQSSGSCSAQPFCFCISG